MLNFYFDFYDTYVYTHLHIYILKYFSIYIILNLYEYNWLQSKCNYLSQVEFHIYIYILNIYIYIVTEEFLVFNHIHDSIRL